MLSVKQDTIKIYDRAWSNWGVAVIKIIMEEFSGKGRFEF